MNKKRIRLAAVAACVLLAVLVLFFTSGNDKTVLSGELLKNGDFSSLDAQGSPEGWYSDAYVHTPGYSEFSAQNGVITIVNHEANDARFAQRVDVKPDSLYCLSGYVKADATGGLGANLSIEGVYVFSDSFFDTADEWREVRLYGYTGEKQTSVTVFARLGGYSGEAVGSASFRNLSLTEVSGVPAGYSAANWYVSRNTETVETTKEASSAWVVLVIIALAYVAVCMLLSRCVLTDNSLAQAKGAAQFLPVVLMLLLSVVLRVVIAVLVPGYGVDVGCFSAWANMMAQNGAADFYVSDVFCDYPPGYILVLGALGWLGDVLGTGTTEMLIKLPSIVCDAAAAALIYVFARKRVSERAAFTFSALYAFNPLTFIAGAAWGQADSVMALGILLVVMLAVENRWYAALPVYMVSVLMKPQALMFGPLGLIALVVLLMKRRDRKLVFDVLIGLGAALVAGLIIVLPFSVKQENPLWIVELYGNTMGYYDSASVNACNLHFLFNANWLPVETAMPWYVRLCAMVTLFGGAAVAVWRSKLYRLDLKNKKQDRISLICCAVLALAAVLIVLLPMNYAAFGTMIIVLSVVACALLYVKAGDIRYLPLLGALLLLTLCNLGVMMHERYLFPAIVLLLLSCVLTRDKRVYLLFALLTASVFLNVGLVLDRGVRIGGVEGHLHAPVFGIESDSALLEYGVSLINCVLTAFAVYSAVMICAAGNHAEYVVSEASEKVQEDATDVYCRAEHSLNHTKGLPRMKKHDWLLMLGVTIVYAVVAFVNLGSTTSPQTMWMSETRDETIVLDLGQTRTMNMLYFGGIHNVDSDFYIQVSDDGEMWNDGFWARLNYGDCFKWQYVTDVYEYNETVSYSNTPRTITGRYVMITARQLGTTLYEVILRDPETKEVFPAAVIEGNGEALVDEQATFAGEPGWYNSTYFDEIYHARTGYEHYMAMQGDNTYYPYETSHPPLGKVLIAFAISVFGMTPFGWRFAGALAGVLMLPGMYMLGKYLTKRRIGAFAAMFLMAVDLMHFTQTRIATIDSFVVLFIIWSYVWMIYYIRMDYWHTKLWKTLIPLALSGLFMGLSVASKWTGCYAGVGLAVLFFWSVWRRYGEYCYAKNMLSAREVRMTKKERKNLQPMENEALLKTVATEGVKRLVITLLCCLGFFVAVPLIIYYASYIPYFMPSGGINVERVVQAAVGDYFSTGTVGGMLGYHGTPGLGMDHPYYSPWYEWPLIGKPMWYYQSTYHPDGYSSTIFAMGNPAVWIGGLIGLFAIVLVWLARHVSRRGIAMHNRTNDMRPAIIIISFAAQYLPWVLVPRGTYIYHYFTAVPFIILATTLCFDYLLDATEKPFVLKNAKEDQPQRVVYLHKWAYGDLIALLLVALAMFIAFYPYASGVLTNVRWLRMMQWFDSWIYF